MVYITGKIENKVKKLDSILVSMFCLLCAERLENIFHVFSRENNFSLGRYNSALEGAFDNLLSLDKLNLEKLREDVSKLFIDLEEFDSVFDCQARCAPICLDSALEYMVTNDFENVHDAISYSLDAVAIYNYETYGYESFEASLETGEGKSEIDWQLALLKRLQKCKNFSPDFLRKTRILNKEHIIPPVKIKKRKGKRIAKKFRVRRTKKGGHGQ